MYIKKKRSQPYEKNTIIYNDIDFNNDCCFFVYREQYV